LQIIVCVFSFISTRKLTSFGGRKTFDYQTLEQQETSDNLNF